METIRLTELPPTVGEPVQLTTIADLLAYERWQMEEDGFLARAINSTLTIRRGRLENIYAQTGSIATGSSYNDSTVFVIRDSNTIVAAGSVGIHSRQSSTSPRLPIGVQYAQIDDAYTDYRYRQLGLNTKITQARVRWAVEQGLPWVETRIDPENIGSIRAKLKAGFIINDISGGGVTVVYAISDEVKGALGVPVKPQTPKTKSFALWSLRSGITGRNVFKDHLGIDYFKKTPKILFKPPAVTVSLVQRNTA